MTPPKPPANPKVTCDFVGADGKPCGRAVGKNQLQQHKLQVHKLDMSGGGKGRKVAFPRTAPPDVPPPAKAGGGQPTPAPGGQPRPQGVLPPLSGIWDTIASIENMALKRQRVQVTPEFSRAMDQNIAAALGTQAVNPVAGIVIGVAVVYVTPAVGELIVYLKERREQQRAEEARGGGATAQRVQAGGAPEPQPLMQRVAQVLRLPKAAEEPHVPQQVVAGQPEVEDEVALRARREQLQSELGQAPPVQPAVSKGLPAKDRKPGKQMPSGRGGREA